MAVCDIIGIVLILSLRHCTLHYIATGIQHVQIFLGHYHRYINTMFHDLSTCSCLRAAVNETFLTFTVHHISPSTIEKFSRNIAFLGSRLKIIFIGSRTCFQLYCTFTWCAITCQCIVIISDLFDLSIEIQISYRFIASLCIIKTESFSCPQPVVLLLLTKVGSPWGDRSILISGIQSCFILFEEIPFHLLCSCISRCSRFP